MFNLAQQTDIALIERIDWIMSILPVYDISPSLHIAMCNEIVFINLVLEKRMVTRKIVERSLGADKQWLA